MDINWLDETQTQQGTPVNRLRLMGMQGYYPGTITITKESGILTRIREVSEEGTTETTIRRQSAFVRINRAFTANNGQTIRQITIITKNSGNTTITENTYSS